MNFKKNNVSRFLIEGLSMGMALLSLLLAFRTPFGLIQIVYFVGAILSCFIGAILSRKMGNL